MTEFFELLQRMPANHGRSPKEPQDIRQLVAATDRKEDRRKTEVRNLLPGSGASEGNVEAAILAERIPRMKVNTIHRHMQDIQRCSSTWRRSGRSISIS